MSYLHRQFSKRTKAFVFLIAITAATLSTVLARATVEAAARKPLLAGAQISSQTAATLERACQNCHSANTVWPWYSEIPPVSWKVHGDVTRAREFMDFSKWDEYTDGQRRGFLTAIAASVKSRAMPPREYLWIHPEARLSDADLSALESWALAEQVRIQRAHEVAQARHPGRLLP